MIATDTIETVSVENDQICLKIDGKLIKLPVAGISKRLASANDLLRSIYTITPLGYGIQWPLIDEDLSVDAILKKL